MHLSVKVLQSTINAELYSFTHARACGVEDPLRDMEIVKSAGDVLIAYWNSSELPCSVPKGLVVKQRKG
jgi:hypothetical protein